VSLQYQYSQAQIKTVTVTTDTSITISDTSEEEVSEELEKLRNLIFDMPDNISKGVDKVNKQFEEAKKEYGVVTVSLLNVRSTPELKSNNVVASYESGTQFLIKKKNANGWYLTQKGWIAAKHTKAIDKTAVKIKQGKELYTPDEEWLVDINGPANTNINISRLDKPSGLNLQQMEYLINNIEALGYSNSKFKGTAKDFLIAERKYNVNALLILSIGLHESSYGTSYLARRQNNLFGLMGEKGPLSYSSPSACINATFKLMREYYLDYGLTTVSSISYNYCDPPAHWAYSISDLMNECKNKAVSYAKLNTVKVAKINK